MTFASILTPDTTPEATRERQVDPDCFKDLNLDQLLDRILQGRDDAHLRTFFQRPLTAIDAIVYRQDVVRDLQDEHAISAVETFLQGLMQMKARLQRCEKAYYTLQKQRYLIEASDIYCKSVAAFAEGLGKLELVSGGMLGLRGYVQDYRSSHAFNDLVDETQACLAGLDGIRYAVIVHGGGVKVRHYADEPDYSAEVLKAFAKFQQREDRSYLSDMPDGAEMNGIEAKILEFVAALHPQQFGLVDAFVRRHQTFVDPTIDRFEREVQFYLCYLNAVRRLPERGLAMSIPVMTEQRCLKACGAFDLALALNDADGPSRPVPNDLLLQGEERVLLVSGPNQGGKTTFARTFGQLHVLAALGLPVPGTDATIPVVDGLYTHFERQENWADLRGKLEDELVRMRNILRDARKSRSVVVMNESFSSTTLEDARLLARRMLEEIIRDDLTCVCVTFLDDLTSIGPAVVSMVAGILPDRPAERTFRIERREPDGRSYAVSLAERHGLTRERLHERLSKRRAAVSCTREEHA